MNTGKPYVIVAALVVFVMTAAVAWSEGKAADKELPESIIIKTTEAYLYDITGTVELRLEDKNTVGIISKSASGTLLKPGTRLRVMEGEAVIKAGQLRLYLKKDDRVNFVIDALVLETVVTVPAGYPRAVTVRTGIIRKKLKAAETVSAPVDKTLKQ